MVGVGLELVKVRVRVRLRFGTLDEGWGYGEGWAS